MKYDCDALLPREDRYLSEKYRWLSRYFDIYKSPKAYLLELTILATTPGFKIVHLASLMQWDMQMLNAAAYTIVPHYEAEAAEFTQINAASITEADGKAILLSMLDAKHPRMRTVPLYATRYLQSQRKIGRTATDVARELGTTPTRVIRWWSLDEFDPLSGAPRRPDELYKHKRFHPGIGVIV